MSRRERFEAVLAGRASLSDGAVSLRAAAPPQPAAAEPEALDLESLREAEAGTRQSRLRRLFASLAPPEPLATARWPGDDDETRAAARHAYARELYAACGGDSRSGGPTWDRFHAYVLAKERELYVRGVRPYPLDHDLAQRVFHSCDFDNDRHLSRADLRRACERANLKLSDDALEGFFAALDADGDGVITFREWSSVLLLLPRPTSLDEIYRYYQVEKAPRHSASQLSSEGDSVLNDEPKRKRPPSPTTAAPSDKDKAAEASGAHEDDDDEAGVFSGAARSFLAGGIAGAVSRTATAPFDRLKVHLINATPKQALRTGAPATQQAARGLGVLKTAVTTLYAENGWRAFFVGNGLNIVKIFPESAIRYASYEMSKQAAAKYWDKVDDAADISTGSRFVAGGIGGITSQLSIYWLETLKTRCMSSTSGASDALRGNALVVATARQMWREGGVRPFFRGLSLGLLGVFPYSALDFLLYDSFRKAYVAAVATDEPGPLFSVVAGATSGGLGAASVYPLNLVRTRLQTQGTSAHPQRYGGFRDVVRFTYAQQGVRGFYAGLVPTLMKVAPSVGISWACFEGARKALLSLERRAT